MSEKINELIIKAKQGDNIAISELMNQYNSELFNLAKMYSSSDSDAEDALQNTYIRAFRNLSSLEDINKFDSWIKQITVNEAKRIVMSSYNQKNTMFSELDNEEDDLNYDPEDEKIENQPEMAYDKKETSEIVLGILDSLSEDQRIVALMHFYENKTLREIAEELEVPQSTVVGRIQTAKKNIKASVLEMERKDGIKLYNMAPLPFFIYLLHLAHGMPVPASLIRALPDIPVDNLSPNEEPTDKLTPKGEPDTLTPKGGEEGVTENLKPQVNEPEVSTETPDVSEPNITDEVPTEVETPQVVEPKEVSSEVEVPKVEQPTQTVSKPSSPVQQPQRRFDPKTGKPIGNVPQQNFDPHTGQPIGMNTPVQPVAPIVTDVTAGAVSTGGLVSFLVKVGIGITAGLVGVTGGYTAQKMVPTESETIPIHSEELIDYGEGEHHIANEEVEWKFVVNDGVSTCDVLGVLEFDLDTDYYMYANGTVSLEHVYSFKSGLPFEPKVGLIFTDGLVSRDRLPVFGRMVMDGKEWFLMISKANNPDLEGLQDDYWIRIPESANPVFIPIEEVSNEEQTEWRNLNNE